MHKKPSAIIISQAMLKMCPSAKSHQMQLALSRHRGYMLPTLQQARAEFEQYIGGVVDWPDLDPHEKCAVHGPLGDYSDPRAPEF